jgi:hypothetical protein
LWNKENQYYYNQQPIIKESTFGATTVAAALTTIEGNDLCDRMPILALLRGNWIAEVRNPSKDDLVEIDDAVSWVVAIDEICSS